MTNIDMVSSEKKKKRGVSSENRNPNSLNAHKRSASASSPLQKTLLARNTPSSGASEGELGRNEMLKNAMSVIPKRGGKVRHLVEAFESILSTSQSSAAKEHHQSDASTKKPPSKVTKWALPGMHPPQNQDLQHFASSSALLGYENFRFSNNSLVPPQSSDSLSEGSSSANSSIGRRMKQHRESSDSDGRGSHGHNDGKHQKRQLKPTATKPFKLRTEQRGATKMEEFRKKVQEMIAEQEKLRIPVAQGLPWTTDEPQILSKPPVKESTKPVDLKLHSDIRAVERAEFDHIIADKIRQLEEERMEQERLQKIAEEEEVKRMRRLLVPRAQPMPYFDRPFIPKRSTKAPTVPQEPKFHYPNQKKTKEMMPWGLTVD